MRSTTTSEALFERAQRSLPGGVGSSARGLGGGYTPYPLFMERGEGARIYDVNGNEYLDYLLAFGPLIFGHRPKAVIEAVTGVLANQGSMMGTPHRLEHEVAEMMVEAVPCLELVRFCNSGSEAVMMALRLARAYTGKEKIVRFEGHYHGWADAIHCGAAPPAAGEEPEPRAVPATAGIPASLANSLIVLPWNDPGALERTIQRHRHEIAAVITEPVMGNFGCIPPNDGYLPFLREITAQNDILLIFDEVITGFRLGLGGAQGYFNVTPDLVTFAKALGGGFPIAAYGGRREIMELIARGQVSHPGTYNTNLTVMAAAKAVLTELSRNRAIYQRLFATGEQVMKGLERVIREAGVPAIGQGIGPMFQIWFSETPITSYREAMAFSRPQQFHAFYRAMLERGVFFTASQMECWFVSTAHTEGDAARTLAAAEDAIIEAKKGF